MNPTSDTGPGGPLLRTAGPDDTDLRLDQFWSRELAGSGVSRERVKEWIQAGLASIDGKACKKPGQRLEGRERLALDAPELSRDGAPQPEDGELSVLYRDESLAVVVKPAGLTTHPAPSQPAGTLVNRLLRHFPQLSPEVSGMTGERPGIVHRLDKDTSGVMLTAMTEAARLELSQAFAERRVDKTYLALVHGRPKGDETGPLGPDAGHIDLPLGRHPTLRTKMAVLQKGGRPASTCWRRLWTDRRGRASLLAVDLHTGRTHQIRVHLAHAGHPLLGDPVYGPSQHARWLAQPGTPAGLATRQMLHAFRLAFTHPDTGEGLSFRQDPPEDFMALLRALAADCQRVVLTGMPGSGKSTLLRALAERPGGPDAFSADACVAELYAPGGDGASLIAQGFGRDLLTPEGGVDKQRLRALLSERPALRRELEGLIHPLVRHKLELFWQAQAHEPLAIAEIPLYFESGYAADKSEGKTGRLADVVVGLRCPDELRRGRFREARGLSPEALAAFESWQWPEERKLAACDIVVDNPGDPEGLAAEAGRLLTRLAELRRERMEAFGARLAEALDRVAGEGACPDFRPLRQDGWQEDLEPGDEDDEESGA